MELTKLSSLLSKRDRLVAGRKPRSVNRQVRSVVAALNRAHELGHVGNPAVWSVKSLADNTEDEGDTAIFLNPAQRAALIAAADEHTGAFLRGLELTGARPKELAAVCVRDFDGKAVKFSHRKGRPAKVRVRYTVLGPEGIEFFAQRLPINRRRRRYSPKTANKPGAGTSGPGRFAHPPSRSTKRRGVQREFPRASAPMRSGTRASASCCRFSTWTRSRWRTRPARVLR